MIYADSGGNPGALLGVSNAVTITAGQAWGWVDFTFPTPVAIQPGTIWMGYIAGSTNESDPVPLRDRRRATCATTRTPAATRPARRIRSAALRPFDIHYSLYATYIPTGGGGTNTPPTVLATATPTSGTAPLTVNFDGSGSSDPDAGDTITYSWDLNGDGTFGDSTVAEAVVHVHDRRNLQRRPAG